MEGIPSELVIVGGVGLVILAALVLVKWGKQILTALLVIAGVVIVGAIAWVMLQRPDVIPEIDTSGAGEAISDLADIARAVTPKSEPAPQPTYTTLGGGGFLAGVLTVLTLLSLGVGGYFWLRWKLAERGLIRREQARRQQPPRRPPTHQQQPPWTQWEWPSAPPVIYMDGYDYQDGEADPPDPGAWGWY